MADEKDVIDMILEGQDITSEDILSDGGGKEVLHENKMVFMSQEGGPKKDPESN